MTSRRLREDGPVPVVLSRAVVHLNGAGTVSITLDGALVAEESIPQVQLGEALSQIVDQLGTAIRVEIHEPDGTVHADILTPPDQPPLEPASYRPPRRDRRRSAAMPTDGLEADESVPVPVPVATAGPGRRGRRNVDLGQRRARDRPELSPPVGATSRRTSHLRELA